MSSKLTTTKNYSLFELLDFNRDVEKIKKLEASMREHGFIPAYPLHCVKNGNGKLQIKAGHHRFEVAKKLKLPVPYVLCSDRATVYQLESSTTHWKFNDFLTSHCRIGSEPHILINEYSASTGISPSQVASMLAGECASSGNQNKYVKEGTFKVKTTGHMDVVAHLVISLKKIGVKFATQRELVSALSTVSFLPEFEVNVFLHRCATNPGMIIKQATVDGYLTMLENVYNRQAKRKIALAFLAKEAAGKRAAVKKK